MCTLSLFQILPSHLVELIIDHVAGSSRLKFDGVTDGSEAYAVLLMPLLSVCRDFRAVVLARYCKIHSLDLTCFSDQGNDKMVLWPERLRGIGFPTHLYAQELDMTLDALSVYNGTVLKGLLHKPYSDFVFPMVHILKVTLTRTTKEQRLLASNPTKQDIGPNICAFVERIRLMAPATRKVCITLRSCPDNKPQFVVKHFGSLIAQLGRLGNTIEHNYTCNPVRLEPPPTGICSLVHKECSEKSVSLAMQLARHNAATLQTLTTVLGSTYQITQLLQNIDGSYVQFPYLHEFKLENWSSDGQDQWAPEGFEQWSIKGILPQPLPVFPGAIPFPSLRNLSLSGDFSFGDDTPFRGNKDTLECLYLCISSGMLRVLKERQVFTHNSHPKLQCVRLGLSSFRPLDHIDLEISRMASVLNIGSNARVRELSHWSSSLPRQSIMPLLGEYTCIQVLLLQCTSIDIWDVIALVKVLPLLTDLHTRFLEPETWPSDISDQHLPAHIISKYAPVGERFRYWKFDSLNDIDIKVAVKCVLLLALVCPNFDYAATLEGGRKLFMAHMKKTISSNGYREHATRLRRLLFGGWKDEIPSVSTLEAKIKHH